MNVDYCLTEAPFEYRHFCWFCGEPKHSLFGFPHNNWLVFNCPHIPIQIPSCKECYQFAYSAKVDSIWQVHVHVKQQLMKHYHKDLAIGLNWTKEELENSGFEGGTFEGFQRSAWFMYEVAKGRVSYKPWPLIVNGVTLEYIDEKETFYFDGMRYPTIDDAINHYVKIFDLNLNFFKQVLARVGDAKFSQAIRYSRIYIGATPQEQRAALADISLTL
ncbi:hypothetical protein ACM9HF_20745 [Colwellia sp. RE-S-Sl-9]